MLYDIKPPSFLYLRCYFICSAFLIILFPKHSIAQAQQCKLGSAVSFLDINNVQAPIANDGSLFSYFSTGQRVSYFVPKQDKLSAIDAASIWIGGEVEGEFRSIYSTYFGQELWPGIIDEEGNPPPDCSIYDRIYNVSSRDFLIYDRLGIITSDFKDWPWYAGAPVKDGDGIPNNYNIEGGDRPELIGDQSAFWLMHDLGGEHILSGTPQVGMEIQAMAGAANAEDPALANTTFYKYKFRYRGEKPLKEAYFGLFADMVLGGFADDYAGADTSLGMGFVYNADNDDVRGYGIAPPAIGIDVLQGPLVNNDGLDNDEDGLIDESDERLSLEVFIVNNRVEDGLGPAIRQNHLRGILPYSIFNDSTQLREEVGEVILDGCLPYGDCVPEATMDTVTIMLPGDPVTGQFWSETNLGDNLPSRVGDRRILLSSGPFTMYPGEENEIVFGIIWARGADHLDSITQLRDADRIVQAAWDDGLKDYSIAQPVIPTNTPQILAPDDQATGQASSVLLEWSTVDHGDAYLVEISNDASFQSADEYLVAPTLTYRNHEYIQLGEFELSELADKSAYFWRVRALSTSGIGSPSEVYSFSTGNADLDAGFMPRTYDGSLPFLEISGPNGAPTCPIDASEDAGCQAFNGNLVHQDLNSTEEFNIITKYAIDAERGFVNHAPNNYEIRFTKEGSYAATYKSIEDTITLERTFAIPFEIWDIGLVDQNGENNKDDDVQMIAAFKSGCYFSYDRNEYYSPWKVTQEFFGVYVATQFQDWADIAESALSDISVGCADLSDFDLPDTTPTSVFRDLQFSGNEDHPDYDFRSVVQEGTIIRFLNSPNKLTPPIPTSPTSDTGFLTPNPVLRWNRVRGAETNIQISTRSDFSTLVVNDTLRYDRTIELEELNWATTYYWRIRSSFADGPFTNWSSVWNFTIGTATNVELDSSSLPETFSLQQNYPNPFNIGTKFQVDIPTQSTVEVKVFNLLGQQVWSLKKEKVHAGQHEFEWIPKHVSSGVYFVTATDGVSRHTIKAVYLR